MLLKLKDESISVVSFDKNKIGIVFYSKKISKMKWIQLRAGAIHIKMKTSLINRIMITRFKVRYSFKIYN